MSEAERIDPSKKLSILDVGVGTGRILWCAHSVATRKHFYVGVDISPEMLQVCKDKKTIEEQNIVLIETDAHKLPLDNNSFDLIFCFSVLQLLTVDVALTEMARVLRDDGLILIGMVCQHDDDIEGWRDYIARKQANGYPSRIYHVNSLFRSIANTNLTLKRRFVLSYNRTFEALRLEKSDPWGENVINEVIACFKEASAPLKYMYKITEESFAQYYNILVLAKD
ncbi:MAG: class I SAM-dependent methyltransferase [Thermodesulfovibrionales bacterium]|jgi:SAM-dependent methyltransferase